MKKLLIFIFLSLFIYSCSGKDGIDGLNGEDGKVITIIKDSTPDTIYIYGDSTPDQIVLSNPEGKAETAFCKKGTIVWATSVDASWTQTGALSGEVKTNDGSYVVRGNFTGPYISYLVPNGTCFSEYDSVYVNNVILRMIQPAGASEHNINYATSLEYYIGEDHFFDSGSSGYGDIPTAFLLARSEIYSYFNFPASTQPFYNFSVVGDTTADAYLLALETVITQGRSGPEQYDFVAEIGQAILNNDLTLRAQIRQAAIDIEVKRVTDNIKDERVALGFESAVAPLWNLPFYPDYYRDLMERNPSIVGSINLSETSQCAIDVNDYNTFAYPRIFDATVDIESSQYYATDSGGTVSIWSSTTCDNGVATFDCPGTQLVELTELREKLLPGLEQLEYNGSLGAHGLSNGVQYFEVHTYTSNTAPSHVCTGDLYSFGRSLATVDSDWTNAIGYNNSTSWFRRSPRLGLTD